MEQHSIIYLDTNTKNYYTEEQPSCSECSNDENDEYVCVHIWKPGGKYQRKYFCVGNCALTIENKHGLFPTRSQLISRMNVIVSEACDKSQPFIHHIAPTFSSGSMSAFEFAERNPPGQSGVEIDDQTKLAGRETFDGDAPTIVGRENAQIDFHDHEIRTYAEATLLLDTLKRASEETMKREQLEAELRIAEETRKKERLERIKAYAEQRRIEEQ